ncbi:MAG TPA: TerD family protein [Telluria sp.]|jgi:tellurium resistance protein TerZ
MSINLQKGQKISLDKQAGTVLNNIVMGLGWDAAPVKDDDDEVDLDASCVMFDDGGKVIDTVWFCQLTSEDGSITHSGDNLTGEGDGDDEQISVDLARVPANIKSLVFTVNSFSGDDFSQVRNAYCRIVNPAGQQEVARYDLSVQGAHTAQIMAKVYRHNGEWKMHAIGENGNGDTVEDLVPLITPFL